MSETSCSSACAEEVAGRADPHDVAIEDFFARLVETRSSNHVERQQVLLAPVDLPCERSVGGPLLQAAATLLTGHRVSLSFHEYLTQSLVEEKDAEKRRQFLARWRADAPFSREVHPREEHLMPLFVMAGAGLEEPCEEIFADKVLNIHTTGYLFGERS